MFSVADNERLETGVRSQDLNSGRLPSESLPLTTLPPPRLYVPAQMLRDSSADEARGTSKRPRPTATWYSWLAMQPDPHLLDFFFIKQLLESPPTPKQLLP